jgi:enoyl-CoA hydratase
MSEEILIERRDAVATITLNRPQVMNALSGALRRALGQTLSDMRDDEGVRVIVLTGAGDRAFSAGLDLKELENDISHLHSTGEGDPLTNPVRAIENCGKPVIGAINGVAITGGFELALACDILIASANARFADTHGLVGLMPGWGLSQKLPRIIGLSRAKELSFTGRFLDAQTALAWGLVNRVMAPEALMSEARALAAQIASVDPGYLRGYRQLMTEGYSLPYAAALEHERLFSARYNRGITAEDIEERRRAVTARGRAQL